MNDPSDGPAPAGRRHPWKLIGPLLAVHGVIALMAIWILAREPRGYLPQVLILSLLASQGSLVGIWVAFGGPATPCRLLVGTLAALGAVWLLEKSFPESQARYPAYMLLAQTLATSPPLLGLRFCGLRIARPEPDHSGPQMQKLQFSLRALLAWTTALAFLMGMLQITPEEFREPFTSRGGILELGVLLGADALVALAALWTALGTRRSVLRATLFGLAAAGAVVGVTMIDGRSRLAPILTFAFGCALCVAGSLCVFRVLGYRLVWRRSVRL